MKNNENSFSGYMLLEKREDSKYRGVDRNPFSPSLIEEEFDPKNTPPKHIWEFYPNGWRRDAYRIFGKNITTSGYSEPELITLRAARKINKIIKNHLPEHEIVYCEIWDMDSVPVNIISTGKDHSFLGYDLAYPGGDYYSAVKNGLFINPDKQLKDKFITLINKNGLFENSSDFDGYIELFKRKTPSEANSTFVIYKMSSVTLDCP